MYLPYLRGKQFELEALLEVPPQVYANTLPILEPVNTDKSKYYTRLTTKGVPLILITNPYYSLNNRPTTADVQRLVDNELAAHRALTLGFIIDTRFNIADLNTFLISNPIRNKALIFRFNPLQGDIIAIQGAIAVHPVHYIIFDDKKTNNATRTPFNGHNRRILLTDGFQRQDSNSLYPASSAFDSNYSTWRANGWFGIGDYLTVGDFYQEGGGQALVISLHVTVQNGGLIVYHFSSVTNSTIKGLAPQKFAQANNFLVTSPIIIPLISQGLSLYRNWHATGHNPQLGAAKKASIMHHMELMASII